MIVVPVAGVHCLLGMNSSEESGSEIEVEGEKERGWTDAGPGEDCEAVNFAYFSPRSSFFSTAFSFGGGHCRCC